MKNSSLHTHICVLWTCSILLISFKHATAVQYAILVGVWDYEDEALKSYAPQNDLVLMESLLSAYGMPPKQMHILKNPKKADIIGAFKTLSEGITEADSLLFYFSGHGAQIIDTFGTAPGDEAKGQHPDLNDEALLPADVKLSKPATYLLDDELNALLKAFKTRQITCLIDTCYSGDTLRGMRFGPTKGVPVKKASISSTPNASLNGAEDILDDAASFVLLIAAAPYNQVVHELLIPMHSHHVPLSAMTYSLYRQTMTASKVTYKELVAAMQRDHQQWNIPWQPVLRGQSSRMNELFFSHAPVKQSGKVLKLNTTADSTIHLTPNQLISAGGKTVRISQSQKAEGQRWAIVIGVDAYPPPIPSLNYAVSDAKAIRAVFEEAGYMVTEITADNLLQPTKANIIRQLEAHAQLPRVKALLVYLSGHGAEENGQGYFIPMDNQKLSLEELFQAMSGGNANQRVIIVDACRVAPQANFTKGLLQYGSGTNAVFTACAPNQWAPESPTLGHGLFTYFLLKGLRGSRSQEDNASAPDGTVTLLSLSDYVMRRLTKFSSYPHTDVQLPSSITPQLAYIGNNIPLLNHSDVSHMTAHPEKRGQALPEGASRDILRPQLENGRFYIYKDAERTTRLPFMPYAWMWGNPFGETGFDPWAETEMVKLDMHDRENPHGETGTCIRFHLTWQNQTWIGVGFFSGPDEPSWWGETNSGWYYDLRHLPKKRLVFWARSPMEGIRIQAKVGILHDTAWGDSMKQPALTRWLKLSEKWRKYQLDLSYDDVAYICSGVTIVVDRGQLDDQSLPAVEFMLDDIYFE